MRQLAELPLLAQLGIFLTVAVLVVAGGEYFYLQDFATANAAIQEKVTKQKAENDTVRPYEAKAKALQVENKQLEAQLANTRNVVPDEKDADGFIKMIQESGAYSGVMIRRFTANAAVTKEYYIEMPFELDIDGTYNNVIQFFDRMSKLPRIVNISNVAIGPATGSVKGVKRKYRYAPNETIVASCTATTFFNRPGSKDAKSTMAAKK
jgi:type IV pilus assembly protein PilO